jgi:hypothetical protein
MSSSTSGGGGSSNSSSSSSSSTSKAPDHTMKAHRKVELQLHSFVTSARMFSLSPLSPEYGAGCSWRGVCVWGGGIGATAQDGRAQSVAK